MESIRNKYGDIIRRMLSASRGHKTVTESNVYQPGNSDNLPHIDAILKDNLLPGSEIRGIDHLLELKKKAEAGSSCLLLLEHYSNFDLPVFHYLLRNSGSEGATLAASIVAIAGIKLNETNPAILAFTETYSRVVIYPSRSMEIIKRNMKDPKELVAELMRATTINRAAMKAMAGLRQEGKVILVFPAGTRYRPGKPETKRGVREIDSYIKSFDIMCLVSINGNILRINPSGSMEDDILHKDKVIITASPLIDCSDYRHAAKHDHGIRDDRKQAVADKIMEDLEIMHQQAESASF